MYKKIFLFLIFLIMPTFISAGTWNVFCYMDSSDDLNDMAIKNITEMMQAQPNEHVTFSLQVHAYDMIAFRYLVTQSGLQFIEKIILTGDSKKDFINAAQWAFHDNAADHTMLVFSNHGWGILDPSWNEEDKEWQLESFAMSNSCCEIKRSNQSALHAHKNHKGFMFNDAIHTYLKNQDLVESLSFITKDILNDKKLDVIGFDTCMGAVLEVAYQIAPYAHYHVGSQSCSLRDGFNYPGIIKALNEQQGPRELVISMVQAFNSYYQKHDDSGIYTHAALDLSLVDELRISLDSVIKYIFDAKLFDLAAQACTESPRFCLWPMYTDLVSLCKIIEVNLSKYSYAFPPIKNALQEFYSSVDRFVVARCGGFSTNGLAHGFAIYLPNGKIDTSYFGTKFESDSLWRPLLEATQLVNV